MNKDNAKDFLPMVKALADGKIIQYYNYNNNNIGWWDMDINRTICFVGNPANFRVKPEPEYPVTSLMYKELGSLYDEAIGHLDGYLAIANAAIKQAILDGDVILPEKK